MDSSDVVVDFSLEIDAIMMTPLEVLLVLDETTPAYTTIVIDGRRLGSQDIPMILNTTPSVCLPNKVVVLVMLVLMYVVSTKETLL